MGAAFHKIKPGTKSIREAIESAPDGVIWIVGRREDRGSAPGEWHLQGVAIDEGTAVAMCRDQDYFIAPMPINVSLPHSTIEWFGLYWPKRKPKR